MKKQIEVSTTDKRKVITIFILFSISIIIIVLGVSFSIFSMVTNVSFKVLNSTIPGVVFGVVVLYLGIRYFLAVKKLKVEVFKESSKFSWSNFKKKKSNKTLNR